MYNLEGSTTIRNPNSSLTNQVNAELRFPIHSDLLQLPTLRTPIRAPHRQRYRQPPTKNFLKKCKVASRDDEQRTLTIPRQFAGNKDTEASGSYFLSIFPDGETVQ
ncbi:diphthamide biosynthesis protein 1 [Striga asiatica]|uniref:Diphthamide biosynthesis protein 1 n=1 Tax=Striga asiatica TaxID=4170 RepID=A0A5A7Q3B0_STRAF|nr:diphthamide biosynthesis protein 1 [Striga asiatica]